MGIMFNNMQTMTATEAKQNFGKLLDMSIRGPVEISRNDRPLAVLIGLEDLKILVEEIENQILIEETEEILATDEWIGVEESERYMQEVLSARGRIQKKGKKISGEIAAEARASTY